MFGSKPKFIKDEDIYKSVKVLNSCDNNILEETSIKDQTIMNTALKEQKKQLIEKNKTQVSLCNYKGSDIPWIGDI